MTFALLLSNRKYQHIYFCLESFLSAFKLSKYWTLSLYNNSNFTTRLLNSLFQIQVCLNHKFIYSYYWFQCVFCNSSKVSSDSIYMESSQLVCGATELAGFCVLWVSTNIFLYASCSHFWLQILMFKFNCSIVYLEIPLGRDSSSCGDWSVGKQWGLTDWFLYGSPYSMEVFLMNLLEAFINNLC